MNNNICYFGHQPLAFYGTLQLTLFLVGVLTGGLNSQSDDWLVIVVLSQSFPQAVGKLVDQ